MLSLAFKSLYDVIEMVIMKVELHSHTHYSRGTKVFYDGVESPEKMVRRAKELGLGALAVTDHNTMFAIKEAKAAGKKHGVLIIPGEEIGSKDGHILALGIKKVIRPGIGVAETVDLIHKQGGVAIAVHPFDIKHDGLGKKANSCDAIEIFNGNNVDRLSNRRARKFAQKNKMIMVAGSDAHTTAMVGKGIIHTNANDVRSIIKSIKNGEVSPEYVYPPISLLKDFAVTRLKMSYDHTSEYMEENFPPVRRFLGKKLLGLVNRSPGNIDKLFQFLAYVAFACTITYSFWRNNIRK